MILLLCGDCLYLSPPCRDKKYRLYPSYKHITSPSRCPTVNYPLNSLISRSALCLALSETFTTCFLAITSKIKQDAAASHSGQHYSRAGCVPLRAKTNSPPLIAYCAYLLAIHACYFAESGRKAQGKSEEQLICRRLTNNAFLDFSSRQHHGCENGSGYA